MVASVELVHEKRLLRPLFAFGALKSFKAAVFRYKIST
jgi:hypothetical protein